MARRNNQRVVNAVNKFETNPKNNLNLESQAKAAADVGVPHSAMESSIIELAPPPPPQLQFTEPILPPQQVPVESMNEQPLGMQQFMPKPSFPEVPVNPQADQTLENLLINPPDTFVDVPRGDVAVDFPPESGVVVAPLNSELVQTGHSLGQNVANTQTMENPLMFDQESARKSEVIQNPLFIDERSQLPPQKQDQINVEVLNTQSTNNQGPLSNINVVPLTDALPSVSGSSDTQQTKVFENPLSQVHHQKQDPINVEVLHTPQTENQRSLSNIDVVPLTDALPSVPASQLSVQILDVPPAKTQESLTSFQQIQTPVPSRVIQPVVRDRINVEFIDTTTRPIPSKRRRNRRLKKGNNSKRRGPKSSKMNFWKTDMQLPSAFFEFMLQGMGFHGIPMEGIQVNRSKQNKRNI
jgi:hypothetical protein